MVYLQAARHFREGDWLQGLASFYPPLFPLMASLVYPVVGDWELAGQLWPFILGVLVLFPLFGLLRRVYGIRVAQVALFFYALSPYLARLSLEVRTEIPYVFFSVSALYLLQRGLDGGKAREFVLSGIISALAYLTRPEGVGLMVVGCFFLLYRGWMLGRLRKYALCAAVLALGFVLFSAPYIAYLRWDTGSWAISRQTSLVFSMALARHGVDWDEPGVTDSNQVRIVDFVASHPFTYLKKVFIDAFRSVGFYFEALHYSYLPFLFIGWLFFFRERFWEKSDFLFLVLVTFYLGTFALLYVTRRYGIPLVPISLGWGGAGFLAVKEYTCNRWGRKGMLVTGLVLVLFTVGTLPKTLRAIGEDKFYLRRAGAYLKEKPDGPTIVTTNGRVAFYAAGTNRILPKKPNELAGFLDTAGGDYLALDKKAYLESESALRQHGWSLDKEFSGGDREALFVLRRAAG